MKFKFIHDIFGGI